MDNSLVVQLGMNIQSLEAGLNKSNQMMDGFKNKVSEVASSLAIAFSVERIASFTYEISKLAAQSEGVKNTFDRISGSAQAMRDMQEATQGTVSQFELMKAAVQADNFQIPIDQMGKLLAFAHQRAVATGQSVDYLVQSIVTGIGRKSPLILDNLGISAVQLREKLKGVGTETASVGDVAKVVGEIAEDSLKKMGIAIETNDTRIQQVNASWENFKVTLGNFINQTGILQSALNATSGELNVLSSSQLSFQDKILSLLAPEAIALKEKLLAQQEIVAAKKNEAAIQSTINQYFNEGWKSLEAFGQAISQNVNKVAIMEGIAKRLAGHQEVVKNIDYYEKEIKDLREQEGKALGDNLTKIQKTIEAEQQKLDILKLQYQIQRDAANTATLGKMAGFDNDFGLDPKLAKTNSIDPSKNLDKANKSIEQSIKLLSRMKNLTPSWIKSFDQIFDKKKIESFSMALNSGMQSLITDLAIGLGSLASGASTSDQIFSTLLSSVGNMAIQLGQLAIGAGIAIDAIQEVLTNPFGGGIPAIAAGVALVAIGSAIKGAASNIAKGGSSHASSPSAGSSYKPTSQPQQIYGTVMLKGQDIAIALSNYQTNSTWTRVG